MKLCAARTAAFEKTKLDRAHTHLKADLLAATKLNAMAAQRRSAAREHLDSLKMSHREAENRIVAFKPLGAFQKERALDTKNQALELQQFRTKLPIQYGLFYRAAGLSTDQIEKFEDLLTEHQGYQIDLRAATSAMGLNASSPEVIALSEADNDRLRTDERELLGDAAYGQLEKFIQTQQQREIVDDLKHCFMFSPTPLSAEQISKLSALLPAGESGKASSPATFGGVDLDKLRTAAAEFLSAPQLAQLFVELDNRAARQIGMQLIEDMHSWARATSSSEDGPANGGSR